MKRSEPQNWIERPGRDPERELREIRQRFAAVSKAHDRAMRRRRFMSGWIAFSIVATVAAGMAFAVTTGALKLL